MVVERDRSKTIYQKLNIAKLPFKLKAEDVNEFGRDVASNFNFILENVNSPILRWCMSTIKKTKVFTLVHYANENNLPIYKEDIAKKLPEYSYKTIATIVDEGIEKGYFVAMDPYQNSVADKKIKNIRPSEELVIEFLNWSIDRIKTNDDLVKKFNNKS